MRRCMIITPNPLKFEEGLAALHLVMLTLRLISIRCDWDDTDSHFACEYEAQSVSLPMG